MYPCAGYVTCYPFIVNEGYVLKTFKVRYMSCMHVESNYTFVFITDEGERLFMNGPRVDLSQYLKLSYPGIGSNVEFRSGIFNIYVC